MKTKRRILTFLIVITIILMHIPASVSVNASEIPASTQGVEKEYRQEENSGKDDEEAGDDDALIVQDSEEEKNHQRDSSNEDEQELLSDDQKGQVDIEYSDQIDNSDSDTTDDEGASSTSDKAVIEEGDSVGSEGERGLLQEAPDSSIQSSDLIVEEIETEELLGAGVNSLDSGSCGPNTTWVLDQNGVLTISGTGTISSYVDDDPPWESHKEEITEIIISDGVTGIGKLAFSKCSAQKVTIPDSVTSIGENAFNYCTEMKELVMPVSARISNENYIAFNACSNIERIHLTKGTGAMQSFTTYAYKTCLYYEYTPCECHMQ